MRLRSVVKHVAFVVFDWAFADLKFFNGLMALISLAQAVRLWLPDVAFSMPGYELLREHVNENVFAFLPFSHWAGATFRQCTAKFYAGRKWFWRVGQFTHALGAVVFALPAIALSSSPSIHTVGVQSLGYFILAAAMVWQVFRTDS